MPEIKNTFNQGKMNKDLDERLIPNGQYKDALNIEVTSGEDAGAGTVRNILGNSAVDNSLIPVSSLDATCVGSIPNNRTNRLYWFVKAQQRDAILEYDQTSGSSRFIAVDLAGSEGYEQLKPFLNFTGGQITGINIVDDFLFWTDGHSEPKKLNISRSYQSNPTLDLENQDHARLYIDDVAGEFLEEAHVTVIRKKPSIAPTVKTITSKAAATTAIFEKIFPRFCFRYKYQDGEYSAFGPFTEVVFNPEYDINVNINNYYFTGEPYNKAMVNLIKSIELYDFVPTDIPDDVVQVDILYKQENSNVVYSVANIKRTDPEWDEAGSSQFVDGLQTNHRGKYTLYSENIQGALPSNQLLRPFDAVPKTAVSQEVIGNRLVYGNYTQGYDLGDIKPGVIADRELRLNQDFINGGLKSLKSLREYQLGVVLGDEYGRETPVLTSNNASVKIEWASSDLGFSASKSLMLNAGLTTELPDWVDYYKFYVKSTSGEYYNLIMDKSYFPYTHSAFENPDGHFYISFPSSDRNKIMEDDYLIAKKIYDGSTTQVQQGNKYKILDISNEAPDAVKYIFHTLGEVSNLEGSFEQILANEANGLFPNSQLFPHPSNPYGGNRIDQETDTIAISKTVWFGNIVSGAPWVGTSPNPGDDFEYEKDIYISWKNLSAHSDRYKVVSFEAGSDAYVLKLEKKISNKDAKLAASNGVITSDTATLDPNVVFKVGKKEERGGEDFSGKFFVKIQHDSYLTSLEEANLENEDYVATEAQASWLVGVYNTEAGYNETIGIINSSSSSLPSPDTEPDDIDNVGFANTQTQWQTIIDSGPGKTFFIDDMNFISSNPSDESWAKESGQGWKGLLTNYKSQVWDIVDLDTFYQEGQLTGFDSSVAGGGNLAPTTSSPGSPLWDPSKIYNSVDGIIETDAKHTSGSKRWLDSTIYRGTTGIAGTLPQPDATYGTAGDEGKFFMHISFLAPGVDLVDGLSEEDLEGVSINGKDGIGSLLEGIWGGGVITQIPATPLYGITGNIGDDGPFGDLPQIESGSVETYNERHRNYYMEFEGNYDDDNNALEDAPGWNGSNSIGIGYDENYIVRHQQQWNPAYSESGIDQNILAFVNRLKSTNARFRFRADPDETVYTIKSTTEKHLYNHTSWRMRWLYDGSDWTTGSNSVEEYAAAWADTCGTDRYPDNTVMGENNDTKAKNLVDKIIDFGRANNRRTCYIIELDKNPAEHYDPRVNEYEMTAENDHFIEFLTDIPPALSGDLFSSPTVWETEPLQLSDLNIYYEASGNIPTRITGGSREIFAPIGCKVEVSAFPEDVNVTLDENDMRLVSWDEGESFTISEGLPLLDDNDDSVSYNDTILRFIKADGSYTQARIFDNIELEAGAETKTKFNIQVEVDPTLNVGLNWFNSYSFGDGIESNRIRDGFNEMQITNGARASATLEEPFSEELRTNGLIYSGIYNSNSGVNNLNQFITAEKITKDLNPTYGSIQKLFARSTDLVALCEDRVLKILANKDALFNADGNPQLVATEKVLGQAIPFVGDYGISQHPESFAAESFRAYFADKQRGAVLRLSMDGLTPISDAGMRDYFRDNLVNNSQLLGTYDAYNKHYNLTIKPKVFTTPIINDNLSEGEVVQEFFIGTELLDDGNFNDGVPFSGNNTVQELLDSVPENEDGYSNRIISKNPQIITQTEITYHPGWGIGDHIPDNSDEVQEGIDDVPVEFETITGWDDGSVMLGFTQDTLVDTSTAFDYQNGIGYTETKFYIDRFSNHAGHQNYFTYEHGEWSRKPTPHTSGWREYEGGPSNNWMDPWSYNDYNIGFGDDVSGDDDSYDWDNPVAVFIEKVGESTSGVSSNFDVSTTNKGITFRGTPTGETSAGSNNCPFGDIEFPAMGIPEGTFTTNNSSDENSKVLPAVLEQFSDARNNTIFNGEEIVVQAKYMVNCYGLNRRSQVVLELLDGNAVLDETILEQPLTSWDPDDESSDPYTTAITNFQDLGSDYTHFPPISSGWSNTSSKYSGFIAPSSNAHEEEKAMTMYLKFNTGSGISDVAVQNLRFRIKVYTNKFTDNGGDNLSDRGEVVITEFIFRKTAKLKQPFIQGQEEVVYQPPVPNEIIYPWYQVEHSLGLDQVNNLTEVYSVGNPTQFVEGNGNMFVANQQTYGMQNYSGPWIQDGVSYPEVQWGTNPIYPNGQVVPNDAFEGVVAMNPIHTFVGDYSWAKLNSSEYAPTGFEYTQYTATNFNTTQFIEDHWYLFDLVVVDEQGGEIQDLSILDSYDICLRHVVSQGSPLGSNINGGWGDVVSKNVGAPLFNQKVLRLKPIADDSWEYNNRKFAVLRGLFKWHGEDTANNFLDILNYGDQPLYFSHIRLIDITDQDFEGGSFSQSGAPVNWITPPGNYQIERAHVNQTDTQFSHPTVYYQDGKANFHNADTSNQLRQDVDITSTNDGYKLRFTLDDFDPDTAEPPRIMIGTKHDPANGITGYKTWHTNPNIIESGVYEITFNGVEGFTSFLTRISDISGNPDGTTLSSVGSDAFTLSSYQDGYINFSGRIGQGNKTTCSIDNVSLVDATNYFSLPGVEGSGVEGWTIQGFDQGLEDFITWGDGAIQFNNAPYDNNGELPIIFQNIEDLVVGHTYELSFDLDIGDVGALAIRYYNANGVGFSEVASVASNGHVTMTVTIGDATNNNPLIPNQAIVIGVNNPGESNENLVISGTIDNIFLKRVITLENFETHPQTITYSEDVKGWVSFKSFIPENGLSLSNQYFTMNNGKLYQHYTNENRNTFYGQTYDSTVTAVLNQSPSSIKNFSTINYEGSRAAVVPFGFDYTTTPPGPILTVNDLTISNSISAISDDLNGWSVTSNDDDLNPIITNEGGGYISEFIEKEGKWFNYIKGSAVNSNTDIDTSKFNFQGLGTVLNSNLNG